MLNEQDVNQQTSSRGISATVEGEREGATKTTPAQREEAVSCRDESRFSPALALPGKGQLISGDAVSLVSWFSHAPGLELIGTLPSQRGCLDASSHRLGQTAGGGAGSSKYTRVQRMQTYRVRYLTRHAALERVLGTADTPAVPVIAPR